MMPKKTLLIVDDHPLFREGLKAIIARDPSYEIVGEAGNGREAMRITGEKKPDLALLAAILFAGGSFPTGGGAVTERVEGFTGCLDNLSRNP